MYGVLTRSAPRSAARLAAWVIRSGLVGSSILGPRGYIIANNGMLHRRLAWATVPRSDSCCASVSEPRFTCTLTASAPSANASSTPASIVLASVSGACSVLPLRCTINASWRKQAGSMKRTLPLCRTTPSPPWAATACTIDARSSVLATGPEATEWSRGTTSTPASGLGTSRPNRSRLPESDIGNGGVVTTGHPPSRRQDFQCGDIPPAD